MHDLPPAIDGDPTLVSFLEHTHSQYVVLRINEDRLISERFAALLFLSSFLAVSWVTASGIDGAMAVRLLLASVGLALSVAVWATSARAARAAQQWRGFAIDVERRLYGQDGPKFTLGPYGRRTKRDEDPACGLLSGFRHPQCWTVPLRWLARWLGMGSTNVISGFLVPLVMVIAWGFAIYGSWTFDTGQGAEADGAASMMGEAEPPQRDAIGGVGPGGEDLSP